ncbi:MAG TPA: methyltransferase domain-containing protein [Solirubrobacteraceae bacterium]|nr:methyltransferase domain-containing protein [Solirubrobacteraceae bacterium]
MSRLGSLLGTLTDPHQFDLRPRGPGAVLDVGCGSAKTPGAVGLDISPETQADVVHDLERFPYPFADSSFDQVLMQDVLEHVRDPIRVVEELHRVLRPNGILQLRTPHFSSALAYGDPSHQHYFSSLAIRSLAEPGFAHYTSARFRIIHVTLDLWLPFRVTGIAALANRFPDLYEKYFAFRFPAMNLRAEFTALK